MIDDPRLQELAQFTPEGKLTPGYGDHYLFFVGRDDIHGILHHLIPQETLELALNMFGYDDDQLNEDILNLIKNPSIRVQASLDKSQAGGVHEKAIISADETALGNNFSNSFTILQSQTHQISHTKGGVLVAQGIGFEGSTNWSNSGEGSGIALTGKQPPGYKAQNNTLLISTNPVFISRFKLQLDNEHRIGLSQGV